jgi:hypothetical protein
MALSLGAHLGVGSKVVGRGVMTPLEVVKGQRARQYVAGGVLDSVRYKGDFCVVSEHGHAFVETIE